MKVIVLGKGYLGKEFERHGFRVLGREDFQVAADNCLLAGQFDHLNKCLRSCDVVVNCIGKSNTRWCEGGRNFNEALQVNGMFPGMLSEYCASIRKKLVHISTGCLFDKADIPNAETELPVAHCRYTLTKWVGEGRCNPGRDLILRPRLYFSDVPDRNNLLCKLPRFTRFVQSYNSYTCTSDIVAATKALLKHDQSGVFHVACDGVATVHQLATLIGLKGEPMSEEELRRIEHCHLVNNTLDLTKLKQFYMPQKLDKAIISCWSKLQSTGRTKNCSAAK